MKEIELLKSIIKEQDKQILELKKLIFSKTSCVESLGVEEEEC